MGSPGNGFFLWLAWPYLGGKGWPQKTAAARRRYLRAKPVSALVYFWTFLTGVLAIISLAGLWIVLSSYQDAAECSSRVFQISCAHCFGLHPDGLLVSPLMEEAGYRGYLQVALEGDFRVPVALLLSSLFFALAHLNHGVLAPKLLVYFLVGIRHPCMAH